MKAFGLIGIGKQGQEHLAVHHLCQHGRIVGVYDPHQKEIAMPEGVKRFISLKELLEQPLDGVIMAIPHHQHLAALQEVWALRPGIAVAKEKPLGRNMAEANRMMMLAKVQKTLLRTLIQRRHHRSYEYLKEQMRAQRAAPLVVNLQMNLGFDRPREPLPATWRNDRSLAGGGALLDSGYHLVDLVLYLMGDFEVVGCTLWHDGQLVKGNQVDDRAHLVGVSDNTWIDIRSSVFNDVVDGKPLEGKFEQVEVIYEDHCLVANRSEVWRFTAECPRGQRLFLGQKDWQDAMVRQLDDFALSVSEPNLVDHDVLWDQQPALSIIDLGYAMRRQWGSSDG